MNTKIAKQIEITIAPNQININGWVLMYRPTISGKIEDVTPVDTKNSDPITFDTLTFSSISEYIEA